MCFRLFGTSNYHVYLILLLRFSFYTRVPASLLPSPLLYTTTTAIPTTTNTDNLRPHAPVLVEVDDHIMNIPAADAFSLNSHSHSHSSSSLSMSTRRALTRSPSPSVLFASSLPGSESSKATRRSKSTAPASGIANGGHGKNSQLHDVGEDVNGETEPNASEEVDKKGIIPEKKKIDWEIPRKLLHSSIGASCSHFGASGTVQLTVMYRLPRHSSVHIPYLTTTGRSSPISCGRSHLFCGLCSSAITPLRCNLREVPWFPHAGVREGMFITI